MAYKRRMQGERVFLEPDPQTGQAVELVPDHRGMYSLCFPTCNKSGCEKVNLKDVFSVAGKVFDVTETPSWVFVRYFHLKAARRALKMFPHLELRLSAQSSDSNKSWQERTSNCKKRQFSGSFRQYKKTKWEKKTGPSNSYRVFVGNLNPEIQYEFGMFNELLKPIPITWTTMKPFVKDGVHCLIAYCLVPSRELAERCVAQFNGVEWFGRKLKLMVKEKQKDWEKKTEKFMSDFDSVDMDLPDRDDLPGLEPLVWDSKGAMSGLGYHDLPGPMGDGNDYDDMPDLEPTMPGLEPSMPGLEPSMPGLEPSMPGLEPSIPGLDSITRTIGNCPADEERKQPTIIVTNFRDDVTEMDLKQFFEVYGPTDIHFVTTFMGRRKAYIELASADAVKHAVLCKDRTLYKGLYMKVDVPFSMPWLREFVRGPASQLPDVQSWGSSSSSRVITLSQLLKIRGVCLQTLQVPDLAVTLGQVLQVHITAVLNDKFFWGQIDDLESVNRLKSISDRLNVGNPIDVASGPGRAIALYSEDNKWYRAWIMDVKEKDQARVFYLDYGNTATLPWSQTGRVADFSIWSLQPMAVPFTLIEPVQNLKMRENDKIMVEVITLGKLEEGNMLVVRAVSLVPEIEETIKSLGETIIM